VVVVVLLLVVVVVVGSMVVVVVVVGIQEVHSSSDVQVVPQLYLCNMPPAGLVTINKLPALIQCTVEAPTAKVLVC